MDPMGYESPPFRLSARYPKKKTINFPSTAIVCFVHFSLKEATWDVEDNSSWDINYVFTRQCAKTYFISQLYRRVKAWCISQLERKSDAAILRHRHRGVEGPYVRSPNKRRSCHQFFFTKKVIVLFKVMFDFLPWDSSPFFTIWDFLLLWFYPTEDSQL